MNLPDAESLAQSYATNHWLIRRILEGVTNDESLVQPPYEGNCLNWVLGHIIAGRQTALNLVGAKPVWNKDEVAMYKTGSPPVTRAEQALPVEKLLGDLDLSQERMAVALGRLSAGDLKQEAETERGLKPVAEHLDGLHWHETYHTGQLELLREMAKTSLKGA